jgi:hypothetical protein
VIRTGAHPSRRRSLFLAAAGLLMVVLTACTGRGGGQLPPGASLNTNVLFNGSASFGFSFSCQDSGGINPPTGKLAIELAYADKGTSILLRSPFGIHGTVDTIDPTLESALCIGQNPPPDGSTLIFLGQYRLTSSSAPAGFPKTCAKAASTCRFEVVVRDNDMNRMPSPGDYFQITLSSATAVTSELDPATVFYTRAGLLSAGNLTVN